MFYVNKSDFRSISTQAVKINQSLVVDYFPLCNFTQFTDVICAIKARNAGLNVCVCGCDNFYAHNFFFQIFFFRLTLDPICCTHYGMENINRTSYFHEKNDAT